MFCKKCGAQIDDDSKFCTVCGTKVFEDVATETATPVSEPEKSDKSKLAAGLLGILLGGYGVHSFYLGFVKRGILQIIVTVITCGSGALWGFIEGILIFAGVMNKDADGKSLSD